MQKLQNKPANKASTNSRAQVAQCYNEAAVKYTRSLKCSSTEDHDTTMQEDIMRATAR